MTDQEPILTEIAKRLKPFGESMYELVVKQLPKNYEQLLEHWLSEDIIQKFDGNSYDYLPPLCVAWAWDYMAERKADPTDVATIRFPGDEGRDEFVTFNLVRWCSYMNVNGILDFLSILRLDQATRKMNRVSIKFRRDIIVHSVLMDLNLKGKFMADSSIPENLRSTALYYYDFVDKELIKGTRLINFIAKRYKIERMEERKLLLERLETVAHMDAELIQVFNLHQWDGSKQALTITNGNGKYFILDGGKKVKVAYNGEGLVFNDPGDFEPFDFMSPEASRLMTGQYTPYGFFNELPAFNDKFPELNSIMFKLTALRCNFSASSILSVEEQQILYYIVLHAMPFVTLLESVPIVSAHGAVGAGKTFAMIQLAKFIFGRDYKPEVFPEQREDFWTIIGNSRLYVFDNVEFLPKWVPDAIAAVATGTRKTKRARYTDWDVTKIDPNLFIMLTSVNAPYRQPAVVERLIPFVFDKFDRDAEKEGSLSQLFNPFETYRNALMSDFIENLNKVVKGISKRGGLIGRTSHRMADFSILAEIINEELRLCPEDFFKTMMDNLVKQRSAFALFDFDWFKALAVVFQQYRNVSFTMTELSERVNEVLKGEGVEYSPADMGKKITKYLDDLKTVFKLERRNHSGKNVVRATGVKFDMGEAHEPVTALDEAFGEEPTDQLIDQLTDQMEDKPVTLIEDVLNSLQDHFKMNPGLDRGDRVIKWLSKRHNKPTDLIEELLNTFKQEGVIFKPRPGMIGIAE